MNIQIADWRFWVDVEATYSHTLKNSQDHCECGYCRNYYDCVDMVYPDLRQFLSQFGVVLEGPSELLPFEPTLLLVAYRVHGEVLFWGKEPLLADTLPVTIGAGENGTFLIWIGEIPLPWGLEEHVEDVISPANTPEFMERMRQIWYLRHGEESFIS